MCLIGEPNLKEMDLGEGCFLGSKLFLNRCKEEENMKKSGNFSKCIAILS